LQRSELLGRGGPCNSQEQPFLDCTISFSFQAVVLVVLVLVEQSMNRPRRPESTRWILQSSKWSSGCGPQTEVALARDLQRLLVHESRLVRPTFTNENWSGGICNSQIAQKLTGNFHNDIGTRHCFRFITDRKTFQKFGVLLQIEASLSVAIAGPLLGSKPNFIQYCTYCFRQAKLVDQDVLDQPYLITTARY